jgi:succinyl-diaminopimelate desuccinylase
VIPARAVAKDNVRYNDAHSSSSLDAWLRGEAARVTAESGVSFDIALEVWGESFVTQPGPLVELVAGAVKAETGLSPELSTTGGTSDARFIRAHCPVVEFGLVGKTMHQVDERIEVDQIIGLTAIYGRMLRNYFGKAAPNDAQSL